MAAFGGAAKLNTALRYCSLLHHARVVGKESGRLPHRESMAAITDKGQE
jgi:hypothetical protein